MGVGEITRRKVCHRLQVGIQGEAEKEGEKFKARVVVKRYSQRMGIDYVEIFFLSG